MHLCVCVSACGGYVRAESLADHCHHAHYTFAHYVSRGGVIAATAGAANATALCDTPLS